MMPAWYERMNRRERVLSWIVAGTVVVLLNLWILSSLLGALASAQKEFATRRSKLAEQAVYVKERDTWTKRDEWMRQHQPVLKNPAEASALFFTTCNGRRRSWFSKMLISRLTATIPQRCEASLRSPAGLRRDKRESNR